MKTSTFTSVSNFICSALTAILIVVPFALSLIHIFVPVLILYPFAIVTVISWVVSACAFDVDMKKQGYSV